ncbi:MAG TPA: ComEC/Rec2 family competence protein, partial [Bryobacteraceae bacterium]|nr:ComEC/Rec2 family competence protein [Bryobacteraceae bacterium]
PPVIDAGLKEIVILDGCVVEPTVFSNDREQFTLELDWKARARVSLSLPNEPQALRDDETPQRLDYGQRVEIEARVRRPHNYNNPGSFDYAAYLARKDIYWTASMPAGSTARVLPGRCGSRLMSLVYALRVAALDRIERLYPDDNYATGMMEATLIGESSKLERVWTDNFRRTGTYHTLVIAGMHVTVLAGVLLFLLRVCAAPEMPALALTAGAAWLYAMVTGFSPPVGRAAAGFTLYLAARFFFRRGRVLNLLAAVALAFLIADPGEMFDASFQLSFLCVAAIGALAVPLIDRTSGPFSRACRSIDDRGIDPHLEPRAAKFRMEVRRVAKKVNARVNARIKAPWVKPWPARAIALICRFFLFAFEMAVLSTVVQVGLALPMAEYFHRVSFSGVTANLLIVPLMNAVIPVGFFAIFTGWRWVAGVAGALLRISARIADWHANLEPDWRIPDPPLWLAAGFMAALIALAIWGRAGQRGWRGWPLYGAVLALFAILLWQPWPAPIRRGIPPKTLELTAIDVGQGDSLLVVFPEGRTMVIDGGGVLQYGRQRRSNLDLGEDVVAPYLWSRDIRRVDIVVATHAHEDHSGGINALLEDFRPKELWVGANPLDRVVAQARRLHIPVEAKWAGSRFEFSGARIEVLSPPSGYGNAKPGNNDSLAFRIVYGSRSFLLTGDMERPMENAALSSGEQVRADVLKVGHHGSKTSTTQPFLDAVSPSIAIISDGFENSFGHPNGEVLARLRERHSAVFRTDVDGLITVRTDGRRIWADTMVWRGFSAWWTGERGFNWAMESNW